MAHFPYTELQIEEMVKAEKQPREWGPVIFERYGDESRRCSLDLIRSDGKSDRVRLIIRIPKKDMPITYKARLLLEDLDVRGVDYHDLPTKRFYKQVAPAGWHRDVINPNLEEGEKGHHQRLALREFEPYDARDFMNRVCRMWNILLPPSEDTLL